MIGKNRKSELRALFSDRPPVPPEQSVSNAGEPTSGQKPLAAPLDETPPVPPALPGRAASGAVKAMGLSLSAIQREADEARALRQALDDGEHVVALDTSRIDASFVADRLSDQDHDDPDFANLVDSMRMSGQQVPILIRPHPTEAGRFQVAYGHRRLQAARRLGRPVKALIRPLTDAELVLAQGKENAERRNLTFIERALFAKALLERGFDRKVVGDALAVQKSELSRLVQVAESVPDRFARAIGPAPKAGRERWMALGQLLMDDASQAMADALIRTASFQTATTDERFQSVFEAVKPRRLRDGDDADALIDPQGRVFARIDQQKRRVRIEFLETSDPDYIAAFAARIREDYASYMSGRGK